MSRFFSMLLVIPLFFLLITYFAGAAIMKADLQEFEEYRLQKTNNYATDAAVDELLFSDDLNQDYSDLSKVELDPLKARDMFLRVLASNYNLPTTAENLTNLSAQYLDLMVVCVYDGYYIITNDKTYDENTQTYTYQATSSIKYPYLYQDGDSLYSYDLGFKEAMLLGTSGISQVACPISKSKALSLLNQKINQEINNRLSLKVQNGLLKAVNIPVKATSVGSVNNNIESVTVLSFLNGVDFNTSKKLTAFSLGGAKLDNTRMVACYKRNNKKMYCYVDLIPSTVASPSNIEKWADYVVNTIEEAAGLGYSCDYELMAGGA